MITEEQLAQLRAQHPRGVSHFNLSDESSWVFRKPTADEWRACKGELSIAVVQDDPARIATAHERLAQACCIHPSAEAFQALRDEDPGVASGLGERLFATFGSGRSIVEGKATSSPAKL